MFARFCSALGRRSSARSIPRRRLKRAFRDTGMRLRLTMSWERAVPQCWAIRYNVPDVSFPLLRRELVEHAFLQPLAVP